MRLKTAICNVKVGSVENLLESSNLIHLIVIRFVEIFQFPISAIRFKKHTSVEASVSLL